MASPLPGTCKVTVKKQQESIALSVEGQITENSTFGSTLTSSDELSGAKSLRIDLHKVDRINSNGVRGWLLFIGRIQATLSVTFAAVSEALIEQSLMTPNILGAPGTRIESFDAPYSCTKCGNRWTEAVQTQSVSLKSGTFTAPKAYCPKCRTTGQFDAMENEYFTFIKRSTE